MNKKLSRSLQSVINYISLLSSEIKNANSELDRFADTLNNIKNIKIDSQAHRKG